MVLKIVEAFASSFFPTQYIVHIVIGIVVVLILHAVCQGRRTTRERGFTCQDGVDNGEYKRISHSSVA